MQLTKKLMQEICELYKNREDGIPLLGIDDDNGNEFYIEYTVSCSGYPALRGEVNIFVTITEGRLFSSERIVCSQCLEHIRTLADLQMLYYSLTNKQLLTPPPVLTKEVIEEAIKALEENSSVPYWKVWCNVDGEDRRSVLVQADTYEEGIEVHKVLMGPLSKRVTYYTAKQCEFFKLPMKYDENNK